MGFKKLFSKLKSEGTTESEGKFSIDSGRQEKLGIELKKGGEIKEKAIEHHLAKIDAELKEKEKKDEKERQRLEEKKRKAKMLVQKQEAENLVRKFINYKNRIRDIKCKKETILKSIPKNLPVYGPNDSHEFVGILHKEDIVDILYQSGIAEILVDGETGVEAKTIEQQHYFGNMKTILVVLCSKTDARRLQDITEVQIALRYKISVFAITKLGNLVRIGKGLDQKPDISLYINTYPIIKNKEVEDIETKPSLNFDEDTTKAGTLVSFKNIVKILYSENYSFNNKDEILSNHPFIKDIIEEYRL